MQIHWIHIIKSFGQYCLAVLLSFAFVSNEKVQLLWIKGLSTRCTQRVNLVYRHFYYIFIEMPWIHITKSFKQYCSAVSLPFAYVLLRGYNFYKKKWFSTLCTQRVNLMTICFYYFFVIYRKFRKISASRFTSISICFPKSVLFLLKHVND